MIKCIVHRIKNLFSFSEATGRLDFFLTTIGVVFFFLVLFVGEGYLFSFVWNYSIDHFSSFPKFLFIFSKIYSWIILIVCVIAQLANIRRRLNNLQISLVVRRLLLFIPLIDIFLFFYFLSYPIINILLFLYLSFAKK